METHRKTRKSFHEPGHIHAYTFSCYKCLPALQELNAWKEVCEGLDEARSKVGFKLFAYVLMPNHVHLLILPGETGETEEILHAIKRPTSVRVLKRAKEEKHPMAELLKIKTKSGVVGRLWQAGGS
ncbi:MAG: transposase [bacterium]